MFGACSQRVSDLAATRKRMSGELQELCRQKRTEARRKRVEQKREQRREAERNATALVVLALTMPATECLRSFLQRSGAGELSAP